MNPYIAWPRSAKVAVVLFMVIATGFLLHAAQAILIPIALSVLVAFLLHPPIKRLQRLGMPRILAVILVVGTSTVVVGGVGFVVSAQLKSFADELPQHEENIETKVLYVKSLLKGGTFDRLSQMVDKINHRTDRRLKKADEQEKADKQEQAKPDSPEDESAAPPEATKDSTVAAGEQEVPKTPEDAAEPKGENNTSQASTNPDGTAAAEEPQSGASPTATQPSGGLLTSALTQSPILSSALDILGTAGLVILLVTFFLIQQADIRDRIVSVAGRGALATTTKALEDAGSRISRYLLMLFVINSTFGISVAIGLAVIGVPYAVMWGLAAGSLRYIPYIGPWIAAVMPISVSLVTSTGWSQPFIVIGLFVVLELLSNNVMEPILYGQSVGISEIGVILAAVVWAWLWGPIGLVLATPMTVCLVVLGRYIPGLRIFDHMLGDRDAVNGSIRLYQRLLARDSEDAEVLIESHMKEHSLVETADTLIVPAVELMRQDLVHDQINEDDVERMSAVLKTLIDEMVDTAQKKDAQESAKKGEAEFVETPHPEQVAAPLKIVGMAAHAHEEALLLELLSAICLDESCNIQVLSTDLLQAERLAVVEENSHPLVIISSLPPGDLPYARQLCKKLKASGSARRIVIARWGKASSVDRTSQLQSAGADDVVSTFAELERVIKSAVHLQKAGQASGVASNDASRREMAPAG